MQVELAGWTSPDIVKSLLLKDMPDLMRKDTEKLMDENAPGKKQAQHFTRREAAIRAACKHTAPRPQMQGPVQGSKQLRTLPRLTQRRTR